MNLKYVVLFFLCLTLPLQGQSAKLSLNLDHLAKKAVESVNVSLDASLLQLAAKFLGGDEVQLRKLVRGLQGIYVRSFDFDKEGAYSPADVEALRKQLTGSGWSCLVSVHSKKNGGSDTDICLCQDAGKVLGMAIVSTELKSLTVVNILGSISLDDLSDLQGQFGVPKFDLDKKEAKPRKDPKTKAKKQPQMNTDSHR